MKISNLVTQFANQITKPDFSFSLLEKGGEAEIKPTVDFDLMNILTEKSVLIPDVSQAVKNAQNTGNTDYTLEYEFEDSVNTEEKKAEIIEKAADEIRKFARTVYPSSNLKGFINDAIGNIMRNGAIGVEWVPRNDLEGMQKVLIIPTYSIRWFRKKAGKLELRQKVPIRLMLGQSRTTFKQYIKLNAKTVIYKALETIDGNPYGVPPFLSVLTPLQTQENFFDNLRKYVKKLGVMGFLKILFRPPAKGRSESDSAYAARLEKLLDDNVEKYRGNFSDGLAVGFQKHHEIEHQDIGASGSADGAYKLNQMNEEQVFSALNQDPALGGRTYSTTETYAGVVYDKYLNGMHMPQSMIADILSVGLQMHLIMKGLPIKEVTVKFKKAKSLTNKVDAEASFMEQKVQHGLYEDGITDQNQYAGNMGFDKPSLSEPRYPYASDVETQAEFDNQVSKREDENGTRQTKDEKEKGVKKSESRTKRK